MVASGYVVELVCIELSCVILLIGLFAQALVYRFTYRRKWIDTKWQMLTAATFAIILQTIRAPDLSAVFGIYTIATEHAIHAQVTASIIDATAVMLISNARSLYKQINRSLPAAYIYLIAGPAILYHLSQIILAILEHHYTADVDPWPEMTVAFCKAISFVICGVLYLAFNNYLFFQLYTSVRTFVQKLEQQEMNQRASITTIPAVSAKDDVRISITQPVIIHPITIMPPNMDESPNCLFPKGGGVRATSDDSPLPDQIPEEDALDGAMQQEDDTIPLPQSSSHLDSSPDSLPLASPSLDTTDSQTTLKVFSARNSMSRGSPLLQVSRPPSANAPIVNAAKPSISIVLATPSTTSSLMPPTVTSTTVQSPTAPLPPSSDSRILQLRDALKKMLVILLSVDGIVGTAVVVDFYQCIPFIQGEVVYDKFTAPDPDVNPSVVFNSTIWLQQASLFVIIWYAWSSITIWSSSTEREANFTPFWTTLFLGLPPETFSRYEKKEQSRAGGATGIPSRGHQQPPSVKAAW